MSINELNDREISTVLAALRLWQRDGQQDPNADLCEIASNSGSVVQLNDIEIDSLCERLNTRSIAPARKDQLEVMSCLVLSTSHIKQDTCDELQAAEDRARLTWQYGCIVYIPEHVDDGDGPAWPDEREDLRLVFAFAKRRGFDWVRFDCDGPTIDELPTYQEGA